MALVDTLAELPADNKYKPELIKILNETMEALIKVASPKSHVWYQVPDCGNRPGNYVEASGSSMIAYALFKGVRMGWLPESMREFAKLSYHGLIDEFITETPMGTICLNKICFVAGLGGKPTKAYGERDGSFAYYISEPIVTNEPKGLGPFILAAAEYERL
jgi:unsaturated rhamnogalacturonyl hydrolase